MNEAQEKNQTSEGRRDFLKKSAYAVYFTPVIVSMLVEKANAAQSWNPGKGTIPIKDGKRKRIKK